MLFHQQTLVAVAATLMATAAGAESATFSFPVNLTNLSPSLVKVRAQCDLDGGDQIGYSEWLEVKSGTVTANVEIKVPLPDPRGKPMPWACVLRGVDAKGVEVQYTSVITCESYPTFCITPPLQIYRGSFDW